MRKAIVNRKTNETNIHIELDLDGKGDFSIDTPIKFFNHMLSIFSKHSSIDLKITSSGDSNHHIIEDTAIALADAINKALQDKKGIARFGEALIPMDETLAQVVIDIGGRGYFKFDADFKRIELDDLAIEDAKHFFDTFSKNLKINLHAKIFYGENEHHKIEALFKALAVSLKRAISKNHSETLPSTKGVL
jgi:imidazoleglycerol-phosphate dehydratase